MFFDNADKIGCYGCEGCVQICRKGAISMMEDDEGFRYPVIDKKICVDCGMCRKVCPFKHALEKHVDGKYVFGGYHLNPEIRYESTSGGAFSAIVDSFCDDNYVIFGAVAKGLEVFHSYITDKKELGIFRKSKYSQSVIGSSYKYASLALKDGKKVLFSGTPCQISGLLSYLDITKTDTKKLLTVEVVCEGVPSPLYIRKLNDDVAKKYGKPIKSIDYRYTGKGFFSKGMWDFQKMRILVDKEHISDNDILSLKNEDKYIGLKKVIVKDRWFNPFWSIWLQHLISRPSCYKCQFARKDRIADITLGDLWGVHIYCPELYGNNGGSSLVICNTKKGKTAFEEAKSDMFGHELVFDEVLKYQGPMRSPISENIDRDKCMKDLKSTMNLRDFNKKWAKPLTLKLFFQKYLWGNRQKVLIWNLRQKFCNYSRME